MSLLDKLNPYVLYIKLAVVAAVLAGAAYGGWHLRGWKDDAAAKSAADARVVALQHEIADYKAEVAKQEQFKDDQRKGYQATVAELQRDNDDLLERIRNANLNTITPAPGDAAVPADLPFNHEFVLHWNEPIALLVGAGVMSDPGLYLPPADTVVARVTREDVLLGHKRIVELFGDCKMKQNKVIEFFQHKGQ